MKDVTSHRRHSKLLYIICLHLRNRLHAKSYSTSHAGQWRYNYYNTSGTTTNSDSSVVVLIEVTSIAWKFNVIIREQTVLRSLWTKGARVRSWTNKRWPAGTTGWGDASHITPIHHVWQSRSHRIQIPCIHTSSLHNQCKPSQSGPMINTGVEKLQSQGLILSVLILELVSLHVWSQHR